MSLEADTARYRLLYDLGCAFAARIDLDELIPFIIKECRDALKAEGVSVLLLDRERGEFYFPYVTYAEGGDEAISTHLETIRFPADQGFAGAALAAGHSLRVDDVRRDPRHFHGADQKSGVTTRNLIATPLISRQGPLGVIEAINRRGQDAFSDDDVRFMEALAGSITIAIENARFYAQIRDEEARLRTQVVALRRDLARQDRFSEMVGTAPVMAEVFSLMEAAAASAITVLIEGETGTGKELVARGIHRASDRAEAPFLPVNCAAMPETLLESELFGHRRGAFTGAMRDNPGLFRAASGGTVFLDEVGDMPLAMQAKLLRVLEEEEVVPLGESFPVKVNVRVISATNRDLREAVRRGTFRDDLFYRLAVFPIHVPPLRERPEDIPLLVQRFVANAMERERKRLAGVERGAMELLCGYRWPGNVRELQNEIDRAVALTREGELIGSAQLSAHLRSAKPPAAVSPRAEDEHEAAAAKAETAAAGEPIAEGTLRDARAAFEARYIAQMLEQCQGNISRAAKQMGVSRVQLQRKVKEYGLR
ncbi:MAG TPA: sigma 54-interacting transcriptional regulator [Candidatus Binataceae bacterium]|nr:sigma 54-interacting transcriptional regulator [Candidatus Binataceae bacterium]